MFNGRQWETVVGGIYILDHPRRVTGGVMTLWHIVILSDDAPVSHWLRLRLARADCCALHNFHISILWYWWIREKEAMEQYQSNICMIYGDCCQIRVMWDVLGRNTSTALMDTVKCRSKTSGLIKNNKKDLSQMTICFDR